MLLPFNKVMRNPTLKTEIDSKASAIRTRSGFPMYAVGQCADILTFRPELVPWAGTRKRIEMCRRGAQVQPDVLRVGTACRPRNTPGGHAGRSERLPRAQRPRSDARALVGLDGVQKMSSRSATRSSSTTARRTCRRRSTRSTGRPAAPRPSIQTLVQYIDAFLPGRRRADQGGLREQEEVMDGHVKAELAAAINAIIDPMRKRREKLESPGRGAGDRGDPARG